MSVAAHNRKLYAKSASTAPSAGDEIDGAIEFTWSSNQNMLDTTDFKDTSAAHTRLPGLEDGSGSISGDWEQADAPQTLLRTSFDTRALVYITDLRDGTNGWTYPCYVESIEENGSVDGKNEVTFNLTQSGARIARP